MWSEATSHFKNVIPVKTGIFTIILFREQNAMKFEQNTVCLTIRLPHVIC
jgi:hypothetical protein